jgi:4a-hydroxytetrahydrobiopterin dehydratase
MRPLPSGIGRFLKSSCAMWQHTDNRLYRKFQFADFSEAFAFMTRVALEAEKMNHHPLWTNVWNSVEIWLSTHDAGDVVTEKDQELARRIDALVD